MKLTLGIAAQAALVALFAALFYSPIGWLFQGRMIALVPGIQAWCALFWGGFLMLLLTGLYVRLRFGAEACRETTILGYRPFAPERPRPSRAAD